MTEDRTPHNPRESASATTRSVPAYYALLGLDPSASVQEVRRAYREKSKLYHPDTTVLPPEIATEKFRQLNEAYATLSSPERRQGYDRKIGFSRLYVVRPSQDLEAPRSRTGRSSAYLDATDRPLSPGELFALFILGITFMACLVLAVFVGLTRGETAFQTLRLPIPPVETAVIRLQQSLGADQPPAASQTLTQEQTAPALDNSQSHPDIPHE